ncbi:MAG: tyrosine-type recombinase/integrase [Clostridia bacterium]|nr:tyrosine-type recombinase/integrase [Clostridia bacterium]
MKFLILTRLTSLFKSLVAKVCLLWGAPHKRHTYATQYYKQTKDIETLRRILGHSDISTTTIYITLANIDVENGMKSFKGFL